MYNRGNILEENMSISIKCQCGRNMLISEELEGLPVRCPNCGRKHLVPNKQPILIAQPVIEKTPEKVYAKPICDKCSHVIDLDSNYCPNCGNNISAMPKKQKNLVEPEIFPGPFKGRDRNHHPVHLPNCNFEQHRNRHGRKQQLPRCPKGAERNQRIPRAGMVNLTPPNQCRRKKQYVNNVIKDAKREEFIEISEKKVSGLAKFAFFAAFLSMLIVLLGVLVVSSNTASPQPLEGQHMQIGFGLIKVSMIFAMLGGLSAFFSIFHFHRKRFLLIFLSILFFIGTFFIGGTTLEQSRFGERMHHFKGFMHYHFENNQFDEDMIEQFRKDLEQSCEELVFPDEFEQQSDEPNQDKIEPLDDDSVEDNDSPEDF